MYYLYGRIASAIQSCWVRILRGYDPQPLANL